MEPCGALVTSFFRLLRLSALLLTARPAHAHDQWLEAEPSAPSLCSDPIGSTGTGIALSRLGP